MKKLFTLFLALALVLTSAAALAETAVNGDELAEVQELNLIYTDLNLLDVNDIRNANEFQVLTEVQEGLFRVFTDEDGVDVTEYAGAVSYEVSDDLLTYTFHLRPEARWSDGEPVTAQNYVDSWIRLLDPEKGFSYAFLAYSIAGAEAYNYGEGSVEDVAVAYIDDYTFSATLTAPDAIFIKKIGMCPFYPIRKDLIDAAEAEGLNWTNDYSLHVFNGPFVISNRVLENSMTLTKNEYYWDKDSIYLDKINLRVVDETSTQAQLVEAAQVDLISLTDLEYVGLWQKYVDSGKLVRTEKTDPSSMFIAFDMHKAGNGGLSGLMGNAKARKAVALALDTQEYNDLFQEGLSTPAYSLVPYAISVGEQEFRAANPELYATDAYRQLAEDPAALAALFEEGAREAGYEGEISDVVLTTIIYSPTTLDNNINEWYKQQIESKLGVQVKVDVYPDVSTWKEARDSYRYDFYTMGWFGDYNDPETFLQLFITGGGYSKFFGGYSNARFDELMADAYATQDNAQRLADFVEAENLLLEEGGIAPLYFETKQYYAQSYVKGVSTPMFGADFEFSRAYILAH